MSCQWQDIDKHNLLIFIRDLSESLQINLKHLVEDMDKNITVNKNTKGKQSNQSKGKKPPKLKKKDIIIHQQTKIRSAKLVQQDIQYQEHKTEYIQRLSVIETKVESNHSILLKLEEKLDKE